MRISIIVLAATFFVHGAFAQTHVTKEELKRETLTQSQPESQHLLDLKGAVRMALENNNDLKRARAKLDQDVWDKRGRWALLLPNVSLVASQTEKKDPAHGLAPAAFGAEPYNTYQADLKATQTLFYYGSLSGIRDSEYDYKINSLDLEISERDLTQKVIQAFYQVLLNQRLLEILEKQATVVNESLATAQSRQRTGRGQLLDVLQVKTELALLKPQIEEAHNQLESAGAQLATLLAETGKYELKLKGSLRSVTFLELQKRINFKEARLPELEKVRLQREQLNEKKAVAMGKHLPQLQLVADRGTGSYAKSTFNTDDTRFWSIQFQLTVPLFSGLQSIDERRSFVEQDRQFDYQGRDLENTLALNQVQSLKALQSAGASLVSAEEAAKLSDQSMSEVRRQFRLGTVDFLQFLTVEKNALQAYSSLDNIKFNNIVAYSKYFVATGQPLSTLVDTLQEGK